MKRADVFSLPEATSGRSHVFKCPCCPSVFVARDGHLVTPIHGGCRGVGQRPSRRDIQRSSSSPPVPINWDVPEVEPRARDPEALRRGALVAVIAQGEGRMWHVQALIDEVARRAGAAGGVDWKYSGGRAEVYVLGDELAAARRALAAAWPQFEGRFAGSQIQLATPPDAQPTTRTARCASRGAKRGGISRGKRYYK